MPEAARPKKTTQLGVRKSPLFFFFNFIEAHLISLSIHSDALPERSHTRLDPVTTCTVFLRSTSKTSVSSGGKQNTTKEQPPECKILPEYEILTWYKAHCWFSHLSSMPTTLVSKIAQKPSHTDVGFKNKKSLRYGRQKALVLVGRQDPSEQKEKPKNHKH